MKTRIQFIVCICFFFSVFHEARAIENIPISKDTLNTIKKLTTISSIDTLLGTVQKESVQLKNTNCPRPEEKVNKLMSIVQNTPDASLKMINHESGFDRNYIPNDLVDISGSIKTINNTSICLSHPAASQLIVMARDMAKLGLKLSVNSGFRSYDEQKALHENYAPIAKTVKYPLVAPPGKSEHQLGLAIDVASEFSPGKFATSAESAWLHDHAYLYGFLISYPEHEEEKTGFMYEPWHLRYVGIENALLLREADYTLAFKPEYYKKPMLTELLSTLKNKFGLNSVTQDEIGG